LTKYREILRLYSQGISQRVIASSCECSRNTVSAILKHADEIGISFQFEKVMSNGELRTLLFPEKDLPTTRKIPDCEYIYKEMTKSGVTLSLLWDEYCQQCRQINEIPLMYSQSCRYYRKYATCYKSDYA
jgi:hypothetical protein